MLESDVESSQDSQSNLPSEEPPVEGDGDASQCSIINEFREFRRDTKVQLSDIKQELKGVNGRLDEAEGRIDEAESVLQAMSTI